MANAHTVIGVVGTVVSPTGPLSGTATDLRKPGVQLAHGETAFFDLTNLSEANHQARMLEALQRLGWPAHVELRSDRVIAAVRIPDIGTVLRISARAAGIHEVISDSSEARLLVDASTHAKELELLQSALATGALVVIAEHNGWIVDVQFLPTYVVAGIPDYEDVECGVGIIGRTSVLDLPQIDQLVLDIVAQSCALPNASDGCIPFLYARTGCWARAHRVCELLADAGVVAAKLWVFGDLRVDTPNVPACQMAWAWHTAAFLRIKTTSGEDIRVIDPSMFPERSASREEWIGAQNDSAALQLYSDRSVYKLTSICRGRAEAHNLWNTGHRETIAQLAVYRQRLLELNPPPPFASCRTSPRQTIAEFSGQAPAEPEQE